MYALANAHEDEVRITFFRGAKLPDPKKLFNAGLAGNTWRAIDLREEVPGIPRTPGFRAPEPPVASQR